MAIEISARKREAQGTGASRRLRRLGKVPGILYGGDKGPVNIELDHQDLYLNLRNERFHASILALDLGGPKEPRLRKGCRPAQQRDGTPVVATVVLPALITEEEEAAQAAAAVAPTEIPTTEQAAPPKEGEAPAEGEKPAAKGGEKPAAADKGEK